MRAFLRGFLDMLTVGTDRKSEPQANILLALKDILLQGHKAHNPQDFSLASWPPSCLNTKRNESVHLTFLAWTQPVTETNSCQRLVDHGHHSVINRNKTNKIIGSHGLIRAGWWNCRAQSWTGAIFSLCVDGKPYKTAQTRGLRHWLLAFHCGIQVSVGSMFWYKIECTMLPSSCLYWEQIRIILWGLHAYDILS